MTQQGASQRPDPLATVLQALNDIRSSQAATSARMERTMDERLTELRREIVETQDAVCNRFEKKLKSGKDKYAFKKKSYEAQHNFNEEVDDSISKAIGALSRAGGEDGSTSASASGPTAESQIEKAKRALTEGKELIAKRQKLLKIADRADGGWRVAEEYEKDPVADNSDDEKRIRKAEKAAEQKIAREKREKSRKGQNFRARRPYFGAARVPAPQLPAPTPWSPRPKYPEAQNRRGPCFACGIEGHFRSECPSQGRWKGAVGLHRSGPPAGGRLQ